VKPPRFEYDAPRSLDEALALLAEHGDEAKALAGGQSLVPLLNFRVVRPARLVDLNGVKELAGLNEHDGALRIGAMTRSRALERSPLGAPLLREAVRHSGHAAIRNRGTVGGSCAHADPTAELPVALTALDARFHVRSTRGARELGADELFLSTFTTALEPDELLTEIEVPPVAARTGAAFVEHARVHGDFALGGAAALVTLGEGGRCVRAAIALLAAGDRPLRASAAERALAEGGEAGEAAALAVEGVEPPATAHAGSGYRRALLAELVRRAIVLAGKRAA
jgi:CO/xanthine dehydrogenase FAD-binding subunit